QCFRYELLARALEKDVTEKSASDECVLIERLGQEIKIVVGSAMNIKITHQEDLILAETLLRELSAAK
ncbi:MAG: 2-C-methyl-D-erythritol 4-phosphate cytidylyltransferase, partial [Pyrinomonadaceae bacterium]|nr:2-C-methyl-D-erythritol 4-phosphate cytidylyltransferase [Pyrinomonadaceae bacterium]